MLVGRYILNSLNRCLVSLMCSLFPQVHPPEFILQMRRLILVFSCEAFFFFFFFFLFCFIINNTGVKIEYYRSFQNDIEVTVLDRNVSVHGAKPSYRIVIFELYS